jgi:hypothetical protein
MRRALPAFLTALLVLSLAASPAQARSYRLKLNLSAWPASLSGVEQVNGDTLGGTQIDLEDTLGVQDETFPELHLSLKLLGPARLIGSYYSTSYEGQETLSQSVTFDDTTYTASEEVDSQIDLDLARVLLAFQVVNFKRVNLGLMTGLDLMKVDAALSSASTGDSQKDFTAPVPVVGVNLTIQPIDKLALYVEISGLSVDIGDVDAKIMDAIVRVEYYFLPWFAMTGGYRLFDFDVTEDDFGRVNFKQDGFQLGLGFRL